MRVAIPIASVQRPAIAGMDALHLSGPGGEFEVAIRLDGHPSDIGTPVHTFGDDRPYHIAGPEPV